jgi:hypothetical protein
MTKKFTVTATVTISLSTEVEAKSAAEAERIAEERPLMGLCWACAQGTPDEEWVTAGELDGTPQKIRVEK